MIYERRWHGVEREGRGQSREDSDAGENLFQARVEAPRGIWVPMLPPRQCRSSHSFPFNDNFGVLIRFQESSCFAPPHSLSKRDAAPV